MPRIPEEELNRIKSETDLVALIRSKGVELKPHGSSDLIGLCPFHNDKNPSLVVTPSKNLWNCLGACNTGGSVIDWVMKADGVSFRHAVEILRSDSAATLVESGKVIAKSTIPKLEPPVNYSADDQQLLQQIVDYYQERLKQSPQALQYLEKRGIKSEEALQTFRIGYADRTLGLRLPQKNRKEGKDIRDRLTAIGIYRESGHEHFNGSVVFPVINENGLITEIYGRKIIDNLREGTAYHTYLPGAHKGFWNPSALISKEVILCEAIIDALSFWVNGFHNVTASYGVSSFTDEMLAAFINKNVQKVYIAYDRDEAGETAAQKLAVKLNSEGIETLRVNLPHKMDVNEYILSVKPAHKSLQVLINGAAWLGKRINKQEQPSTSEPESTLTEIPSPSLSSESFPLVATAATEAPERRERINVPYTMQGEDIKISLGDRQYRIRGLRKNLTYETLKLNIRILQGEKYYIDTLDLYNARHRTALINAAAEELACNPDIVKHDLGKILLKLEELQSDNINETMKPKEQQPNISEEDRKAAMALLKDPNLLGKIREDVEACGIVGEKVNALMGYLAAVSRKLDKPLGVIVQSSSAAGKSSLMDAVLAFMPPEDRIKYSAMTGQSLFYMGESDLKHKILAIVEEEGAERASYALKLLQSEGELTIASTGKEASTGRLITHEYRVDGPVMIFLTTTSVEVDEELQNRCLILSIDESKEQTAAIHQMQRELMTFEGLVTRQKRKQILHLHQNAQRLLRPIEVINPYAPRLTFLNDRTRARRDHMKYLYLINAIALLHQHQRPIQTRGNLQYIEATMEDIAVANELAHEVLGRSLGELPPQTHRLLLLLDDMVVSACKNLKMVRTDYRFTRKDVRRYSNLSDFQVHLHLSRLVDLEYVAVHRGGRGQSFVYELIYDGQGRDGKPFILGLLDIEQLKNGQLNKKEEQQNNDYDEKNLGVNQQFLGSISPHLAPV
jgi:DNA primase